MVTPSGHAIQHSPVAPLRPQPCERRDIAAAGVELRTSSVFIQTDRSPGGGIATKAEVKE
jgi:hypothetical protein